MAFMLPGGGVEPHEDLRDGAVREAREEVGIEVDLVRFIGDFSDEHSQRRFYLARRIGGRVTAIDADNHRPVQNRRVPLSTAKELVVSEFDRAALERVERLIASGEITPA